MVPYASFPYAEHAIRLVGGDPQAKADPAQMGQIQTLIEAAQKLRQLVKDMDNLEEIKGFLLYKPDTTKQVVSEADQ